MFIFTKWCHLDKMFISWYDLPSTRYKFDEKFAQEAR